jgi:hypothetical protein
MRFTIKQERMNALVVGFDGRIARDMVVVVDGRTITGIHKP